MEKRPNVIIITTDQMRVDSMSAYGSAFTHTPNLDRLGVEGAICSRAYTVNPVCTPARASLFSGQYPSRHGAWNVGMNTPGDVTMISHHLAGGGYRTHYVGKMHFQPFGADGGQSAESREDWESGITDWQTPYYGFETVEIALGHATYGMVGHYGDWVRSQVSEEQFEKLKKARRLSEMGFGGEAHDWEIPLHLHNSVWTADRSIAFLEEQDESQPFLLAIGFEDPHHPHAVPVSFEDRVDPADVPLPRYEPGELDDQPPHFRIAHEGGLEESAFRGEFHVAGQGSGADFRRVSEEDARLARAYYYTLVRLIDQQMGRIVDCLDRCGLAQNTIVVFTTDHGELLGDHGLWMKGPFLYEPLVNIPMLIRWPEVIPAGQRVDGLINQVDIVPTILSAIGEPVPAEVDGMDMMPMLNGKAREVRDSVIVECVDDPAKLRLKTVITQDRKLTLYHGHDFGELYDLASDPGEIRNLWDDRSYLADRRRLTRRVLDHMERLERRERRMSYA